jgi:hypothetical protein
MKTYRILTQGYDLILGNHLKSVKYVLDDYDKVITRVKEEKRRMSVPNVIKWNSIEIQEFEFVKKIDVEI